jgi:stalled ribosome rescue protein Dom34
VALWVKITPMKSECTLNDLVDYLYNETQLLKTVEVQYTIDNNEEVKEIYQDMVAISNALENSIIAPPTFLRESIMNYARITAPF